MIGSGARKGPSDGQALADLETERSYFRICTVTFGEVSRVQDYDIVCSTTTVGV